MTGLLLFKRLCSREFILLLSHRQQFYLLAVFFLQIVVLFPFGIDPQPELLVVIGQAMIPICGLLASLLLFPSFFLFDRQEGVLYELLLLPTNLIFIVYAKVIAHTFFLALILALLTPITALQYQFDVHMTLRCLLVMLLLSPILASLGAFASALTLGLSHQTVLPALIYLPLSIPALIFSTLIISRGEASDWYLLGAFSLMLFFFLPLATSVALRWSTTT